MSSKRQKTVVIGAGPVGSLAALYAARRGHDVDVYEMRDDLRLDTTNPLNFTKSINLALSERGINSIRSARCSGLLESILRDTIPMHGRMIHGRDKRGRLFEESQKYDAHGRFIRAADRAQLNKQLLDELAKYSNVSVHFSHKLTGADCDRKRIWLQPKLSSAAQDTEKSSEIETGYDLLIGADGAHSHTRSHLMKFARMSYSQEYIDTLWCEFHIAPTTSGFAISPNHLHIWPAHTHMFIAIPSSDRSFTCTLFAPVSHFQHLEADPDSNLGPFFQEHFPGIAGDLIDGRDLVRQFQRNPHLPLITLNCEPYHHCSKDDRGGAVIIGDAAHAMVPFYGQGMNAGLEDVRVLFEHLDRLTLQVNSENPTASKSVFQSALSAYSEDRKPDAHTITRLALLNYAEMRSSVLHSPLYHVRKWLEEWLSVYAPWTGFATRYARVSFGNERYSAVERNVEWQGRMLGWFCLSISGMGTIGLFALGTRFIGRGWIRDLFGRDRAS